jgi:hypothetical protein
MEGWMSAVNFDGRLTWRAAVPRSCGTRSGPCFLVDTPFDQRDLWDTTRLRRKCNLQAKIDVARQSLLAAVEPNKDLNNRPIPCPDLTKPLQPCPAPRDRAPSRIA